MAKTQLQDARWLSDAVKQHSTLFHEVVARLCNAEGVYMHQLLHQFTDERVADEYVWNPRTGNGFRLERHIDYRQGQIIMQAVPGQMTRNNHGDPCFARNLVLRDRIVRVDERGRVENGEAVISE